MASRGSLRIANVGGAAPLSHPHLTFSLTFLLVTQSCELAIRLVRVVRALI